MRKRYKKKYKRWLFASLIVFIFLGGLCYFFFFFHNFQSAEYSIVQLQKSSKYDDIFSEIEDLAIATTSHIAKQKSLYPDQTVKILRPEIDLSSITSKENHKKYCTSVSSPTMQNCLAIIIDDVAYKNQVKSILQLGIPINISFFPPNWRHPDTPILAKDLDHYMIHLPLEALHYPKPEPNTITTTSSEEEIEKFIKKIRHDFPKARYVNNHTGSKFTADYRAMKRLLKILFKYNFAFVDSRTTAQTKVKEALAFYRKPYIHRNIFLDNKQNVSYIKKQLKKAVDIAKKEGLAIAIGHPHPATLKAIAQSQGILKEVRLIYLDELRFRSK